MSMTLRGRRLSMMPRTSLSRILAEYGIFWGVVIVLGTGCGAKHGLHPQKAPAFEARAGASVLVVQTVELGFG